MGKRAEVSDLVSRTLVSVKHDEDKNQIIFTTKGGRKYRLFHDEDCCEVVRVEDICGDLDDLVGLVTESEVICSIDTNSKEDKSNDKSSTYTFYKFRTKNGSVTIRWYGTSNGYYSEKVSFEEME